MAGTSPAMTVEAACVPLSRFAGEVYGSAKRIKIDFVLLRLNFAAFV